MRHPISFYKIYMVKCRAIASPMPGSTSKVMQAARLQWIVMLTSSLACIELLYLFIVLKTTPFQKNDIIRRIHPFQCHANAGSTGTYNTNIAFYYSVVWEQACIL